MDFTKKILSDPQNRWVFDHAPDDTYLVGGYIRDLLRGEIPEDKDFVLKGDAEKIGQKAARMFGGKVIALQNKQTYRVALKEGNFIDFSPLQYEIMEDLQRRDFTINAIAWSPGSGIICPDNCLEDVKNRVVRHIKPQNLLDDPLRILRAYRLAAQFDFRILNDTRGFLKKYSEEIERTAPERITQEVFKLLNTKNAIIYIKISLEDNVLSRIIKITNSNYNQLFISLKSIDNYLEKCFSTDNFMKLHRYCGTDLSQGLKKIGFIRLFLLLHSSDNKALRMGNAGAGSELLYKNTLLRVSSRIRKALNDMEKAESICSGRITDSRLYQVFRNAGESVYEIAMMLAIRKPGCHYRIMNKATEFLHQRNNTLLNGNEIKRMLGIESGRVIGEIKERIYENQFRGNIRNYREAQDFVVRNFT